MNSEADDLDLIDEEYVNDVTPLTDAVVELVGADGKVNGVISRVRRAILSSNRPELAQDFIWYAVTGGRSKLLKVCLRFVTAK